jgi:hypothetical protein
MSMTWTTSSGQLVNSNTTNDTTTGLFQSTIYITATTSDIPVHHCNITFDEPTSDTVPPSVLPPRPTQATNAPNYSSAVKSSAYSVQYCPRTIKVLILLNGTEFYGGEVEEETYVQCSVDGGSTNVNTTYTWINTTNGDVLTNSPNVTIPVGDYDLTCTANSTVSCGAGSSKTCGDLTKNISGTSFQPSWPLPCYERPECIVPAVVVPVVVVAAAVIVGILMYKGIIPKPRRCTGHKQDKQQSNHGTPVDDTNKTSN